MTQPAHADTEKATPRPWTVKPSTWPRAYDLAVYDADGRIIANIGAYRSGEEAEANRALIVAAVNAYDAMREVCELLIEAERIDAQAARFARIATAIDKARAALAAAEGKVE